MTDPVLLTLPPWSAPVSRDGRCALALALGHHNARDDLQKPPASAVGRCHSLPVLAIGLATGLDSGEPRWRKKIESVANARARGTRSASSGTTGSRPPASPGIAIR